jgi:hypothetical protein
MQIITAYSENHMKHINGVRKMYSFLNTTAVGTKRTPML